MLIVTFPKIFQFVAVAMFQSLIGILVNCNAVKDIAAELGISFQSLIGILVNCNRFAPSSYSLLHWFQSLIGILVNCNEMQIESASEADFGFNP